MTTTAPASTDLYDQAGTEGDNPKLKVFKAKGSEDRIVERDKLGAEPFTTRYTLRRAV